MRDTACYVSLKNTHCNVKWLGGAGRRTTNCQKCKHVNPMS